MYLIYCSKNSMLYYFIFLVIQPRITVLRKKEGRNKKEKKKKEGSGVQAPAHGKVSELLFFVWFWQKALECSSGKNGSDAASCYD